MESKKICFVIPSLNVGGMERVMIEIVNYVNQHTAHEVSVIKLTKGKNFYELPKDIRLYEPDFVFSNQFRIFYSLKTFFFLLQTLKKIKPDSVLSFGEMYNSFVLLTTLFTNVRVFVSDRSQPDRKWGTFHEKMRRFIYNRASGIIAQTSYSKNFLYKELRHENIKVIANPGRAFQVDVKQREKIVINVGRLIPNKRIDLLIEIFSEINHPEWKLWIIGDGPEQEKLETLLQNSPAKNAIKIWGAQKNVKEFYAKSELFAFTSISEGFPNVLVEALEFGLPCLSFDCVAGPSDIIDDGVNGFLIPVLDKETYKKRLLELMNDEFLIGKMAVQATESAKKYSIEIIGKEYITFLTS